MLGDIGMKLIADPEGTVRRLVRSKLWQKVAGVTGSVSDGFGVLGLRLGVGEAALVSRREENE